jgi:predicted nucleic acid-binding protein
VTLVLDASVILKWLLEDPQREPDTEKALMIIALLSELQWPATGDTEVMRRATQLAINTGGHLFETLYHAIALEHPDTTLITADERYVSKAKEQGCIQPLKEWTSHASSL